MAAKNKRSIPDFHGELAAYLEASAHEWAEKCFAYREAGNFTQAKAAERKARHWQRRAMLLKARTAIGKPHGGRGAQD